MKIHSLGLPRIGKKRELKRSLEKFWKGSVDYEELKVTAQTIKKENWNIQLENDLDLITVGDFSFYDHVLDTSFLLGNIPQRFLHKGLNNHDQYFAVARGINIDGENIAASEMRKWFNTNYHYIVPEFSEVTNFKLNPDKIEQEINEALEAGIDIKQLKPVITGPLTYLWIGKEEGIDKLSLLPKITEEYKNLINLFIEKGIKWVQIDEPILVFDKLDSRWTEGFDAVYNNLKSDINILIATYFEGIEDNINIVTKLPVQGVHLDITKFDSENLLINKSLLNKLGSNRVLSLGVISGRNIWVSNLKEIIKVAAPLLKRLGEKLWLAPGCSLLHVPVTVEQETKLTDLEKQWLKFAYEKVTELSILKKYFTGYDIGEVLGMNKKVLNSLTKVRKQDRELKKRLKSIKGKDIARKSQYCERALVQRDYLDLPLLPTTTIGSFPQTFEIRKTRLGWRKGDIGDTEYEQEIKKEIKFVIEKQEELGLDVLVHGEPERTDMVEYFGELLDGYLITGFGWVQSYGSRCVKPPIVYKDVTRINAMTVKWIEYAQSLTDKHVKGMLTGPVTMLKWAFVRQDIPLSSIYEQVALTLNDEVNDLISAGIKIIQIDEAALKEALPLKNRDKNEYIRNASRAFRICSMGVSDKIQIHTHMCYSTFDDILSCISDMDSDVITIETTRSEMGILSSFPSSSIVNEIGPGVYDIHSPNIPEERDIEPLVKKALEAIPVERLWINPDCGLKTRRWEEVVSSLGNLVNVAKKLREGIL